MNGTESVVFILGFITQSGFCPGLQLQTLGPHQVTDYLIGSLSRLNTSRIYSHIKRVYNYIQEKPVSLEISQLESLNIPKNTP